MIHATKRAIATVLRRVAVWTSLSSDLGEEFVEACSGAKTDTDREIFSDWDAMNMVAGREYEDHPTCPVCLVLLDEAMLTRKTEATT